MKKQFNKPPSFAVWLLNRMIRSNDYDFAVGDLIETYGFIRKEENRLKASIWFWSEILRSLPGFIKSSIWWRFVMYKNYFKVALRNLKKNKLYSFINVIGLALGMACCILILLWVQDELSYDRFHENADRLFRVVDHEVFTNGDFLIFTSNPPALALTLKDDYPEIVNTARYTGRGGRVIKHEDRVFKEDAFACVDPSLFEMFTFPFISGNAETALSDPYGMVITEEMASKYFGTEEPMGKTIRVDNRLDFHITGVIRNIPSNSHLRFSFVIPFQTIQEFGRPNEGWGSFFCRTYVLLDKNADSADVNEKISEIIKQHYDDIFATISLQSIQDIHLHSSTFGGTGDFRIVILFSIIAGFVLLTACINFMNLATARSGNRSLEIGLRKVVGAGRKDIIGQFYGETMLLSFIALLIAIILVHIFLPSFNALSGKQLSIHFAQNLTIFLILIGTAIITGLISGSYPALFLSSFQPVKVLSGTLKAGTKSSVFRKILVTVQFVFTISLIIGTIVMSRQLNFIRNHKLGYNKEHVVCLRLQGDVYRRIDLLKNEFMKDPGVLNSTAVSNLPTAVGSSVALNDWEGRNSDDSFLIYLLSVDHDYLNTLQMGMAEGRFFSRKFPADTADGVIVNETAVRIMGMESPVGKRVQFGRVVGVLKDFHFRSLHRKIDPLMIYSSPRQYRYLMIRIKLGEVSNTIQNIENAWRGLVPEFPFEFQFLDVHFDRIYRSDQRVEKIINTFTFLTLSIACLGLFGLATFTAEQRTKEIGIRKVLGASISRIIVLLAKEFTKWVIVANIVAWPLGYFVMNKLLQGYAYRIKIGWWMFVFSGGMALLISLITVSFQAFKAARANPVEALKYE